MSVAVARARGFLGVDRALLLSVCLVVSCGSSSKDDLFQGQGSPPPAAGGQNGAAGAGSFAEPSCSIPSQCNVAQGQVACCTVDAKCGVRIGSSLPHGCVTPDPGKGLNQGCPTSFVLGGTGYGCCRSSGTCGYMDPSGNGCIDPVQFNLPPGIPCP
jgi:hypothetical protein